jgi:hypothetical protein
MKKIQNMCNGIPGMFIGFFTTLKSMKCEGNTWQPVREI